MVSLEERVRGIAESYVQKKSNALLTIGIIHKERQHVFAYGDNPLQKDIDPREIVYEIGSISKVFTTSMLAHLLQAGTMALGHSISRYWPEIGEGHPITIEQLATHTSGLPSYSILRDVRLSFAPKAERDPYCQYTLNELEKWIQVHASRRRHKFRYSNVGMGLLGSLMARHEKTTFEQLLGRWITGPLGMSDTFISISSSHQDRILSGHSVQGKPVPPLVMNDFQGAGAIRSTTADLLRFLQAHMNAEDGSALALTHIARARMNGRLKVGLGWVLDQGLIMHNGATNGFSSYMGFRGGTGVIVLSNYRNRLVQDSPDRIGYDLMAALD
ncbi:serine hydrolase domain-containing protein [Paenibacillaceae bacterium WGS1546]|uniref:serine hydrolase domain-containing protein n=1 Tax=Cohnella sp. WGS1546 TaxID=3366810 RepID=UPI00372D37C5